jgi:hypothetical protein
MVGSQDAVRGHVLKRRQRRPASRPPVGTAGSLAERVKAALESFIDCAWPLEHLSIDP